MRRTCSFSCLCFLHILSLTSVLLRIPPSPSLLSNRPEDKQAWEFIRANLSAEPRKEYLSLLGLNSDSLQREVTEVTHSRIGAFDVRQLRRSLEDDAPSVGMFSAKPGSREHLICKAISLGNFEAAVDLCLAHGNLTDALMLGIAGGSELLARVQQAYYTLTHSPVAKLLHVLLEQRWTDVVAYTPVEEWTQALATVLTYASNESLSDLCAALAQRLEQAGGSDQRWGGKTERQRVFTAAYFVDASSATFHPRAQAGLCYICAGKVPEALACWEALLQGRPNDDPAALQLQLVEQATVLRMVRLFLGFFQIALCLTRPPPSLRQGPGLQASRSAGGERRVRGSRAAGLHAADRGGRVGYRPAHRQRRLPSGGPAGRQEPQPVFADGAPGSRHGPGPAVGELWRPRAHTGQPGACCCTCCCRSSRRAHADGGWLFYAVHGDLHAAAAAAHGRIHERRYPHDRVPTVCRRAATAAGCL